MSACNMNDDTRSFEKNIDSYQIKHTGNQAIVKKTIHVWHVIKYNI